VDGSDEYFDGRRWRVASELTGREKDGPATVAFTQGRFTVTGGKFSGPGSSARGAKGILLQEIDDKSEDIEGSLVAVGESTFRRARKAGAV
jgi:hypothetical protein